MLKWFGVLLFLFGVSSAAFVAHKYNAFSSASPAQKLAILWAQDLESLKANNALPKEWGQIREVGLISTTDRTKQWITELKSPIQTNSEGQYRLDVMLISWEDSESEGAILQYNLIDLKTQNMVWELGRTFLLSGEKDQPAQQVVSPQASDKNK